MSFGVRWWEHNNFNLDVNSNRFILPFNQVTADVKHGCVITQRFSVLMKLLIHTPISALGCLIWGDKRFPNWYQALYSIGHAKYYGQRHICRPTWRWLQSRHHKTGLWLSLNKWLAGAHAKNSTFFISTFIPKMHANKGSKISNISHQREINNQ